MTSKTLWDLRVKSLCWTKTLDEFKSDRWGREHYPRMLFRTTFWLFSIFVCRLWCTFMQYNYILIFFCNFAVHKKEIIPGLKWSACVEFAFPIFVYSQWCTLIRLTLWLISSATKMDSSLMESGLRQENAIYSNIAVQYNEVVGPVVIWFCIIINFWWKYHYDFWHMIFTV